MSAWGARQLARLGLDRPELRAWAMYDFANSAFLTVIISSVFPVYFAAIAAPELSESVATRTHALATAIGMAVIAVLSPYLGALGDYTGRSKRLFAAFLGLAVAATAAMVLVDMGDWRLGAALFVAANIGAAGSFVFYDAMLPHIASRDEMDRVSSAGYALGYVGGGLALLATIVLIRNPGMIGLTPGTAPVRVSFLGVAVWWAVFSIPFFRRVPEPPRMLESDETGSRGAVRTLMAAHRRLLETFHALRAHRDAFVLLLAFVLYNDGIGTIIRMAAIYGKEVGIGDADLVGALLVVQFVGIPCAFGFGALTRFLPAKRAVLLALAVYVGITIFAANMKTARDFWVLAILVGAVMGGAQALSRSLFANMIPRHKSAEFFGFFGVAEKFAGIFGPLLFWGVSTWTGSSAIAVLMIAGFFVAGGVLLLFVDVERGGAAARASDLEVRPA